MSKKKHPYKYLIYKGRFGRQGPKSEESSEEPDDIIFNEGLCVYDDDDFGIMSDCMNRSMQNPDLILDMRDVSAITIRGALILKAFFNEFSVVHNRKPKVYSPRSPKMRAVMNYLGISHYKDVERLHYKDIECWQIKSWDFSEGDVDFTKMLHEEIIPKCWPKDHSISEHSATIASSVTEALLNCKEHAYSGVKKSSPFKRWYLGAGEYPRTGKFAICIYDKGIGIISSLKENPSGWFDGVTDTFKDDSSMIALATRGRTGSSESAGGRGQGLKSAIELLSSNSGDIDIYSDHGFFSNYNEANGKDRISSLEGTMVAFSFPLEYN
jgi:hypothetical protein